MYPTAKTTFEQFKADLERKHGVGQVRFEQRGENGWSTVDDLLADKPGGQPGPRWCVATPRVRTGYLLGKFDFTTSIATFFA